MSKTSRSVTKGSQMGGIAGPGGAVDCLSLTDNARLLRLQFPMGAFTQNATTSAYYGPAGVRGIVLAAYLSAHVVPAGGTLSAALKVYDASATALSSTLASLDPETLTIDIATAMTLAAANDAFVVEATDTWVVEAVADNNTVSAAGTGCVMVVLFLPLESATAGVATITGTDAGL